MENKTKQNILIAGLLAVIVIAIIYVYSINRKETQQGVIENQQMTSPKDEAGIQQQTKQLDELRGANPAKFTDEEIQTQIDALNDLREGQTPATQEKIDEQLRELDRIKQENK